MKTSHPLLILGCVLLMLCTGCQFSTGYSSYDAAKWSPAQLAHVRIELAHATDASEITRSEASTENVAGWTREVLATVPGVRVASPAATTAPAASADTTTTCRITVGQASGHFAIMALPPAWDLGRQLRYDVEVYDDATHARLFRAVREVKSGGVFNIFPFKTTAELFKGDLAQLFAVPAAPK